ncbi:truncated IS6110 transposase [Mycobacterium tuberculosis H37Ra]|uniref:Truncated IS6110 transposase n=1 Tax=Mycobacterium tuberculosis (strain ATCC 25177 / H37Ra) TaxID=419947 RepID=A5U3D2_MYCTA|nr:truncated IS6110 transposase [Mycobacterium tuberculosis H37Ra]PHG94707.1 IS3 family transposase [Mycobacterium tuberculosis]
MSSWPPRAGSTGSTIAASTSTAATSRRSNSRLPTTLNARDQPPAEVSDQRVSGLTGAVQAETINGLYKTELIKPGKPWRSIEDVELATARWVDWFNHRRLYQYCGDVPPVELEAAYYAQRQRPAAG